MPDDRFLHRRSGHSAKVSGLTDLEFRVWTQYLLSADDFGVMRASAVTMQADNDALNERPAKAIQKAIETLSRVGLVRSFEHQSRAYLFQHDWQSWQKVSYPRKTNQPKPCPESLGVCDAATVRLFELHPGGDGKKFTKGPEKDSGKTSGKTPEELPTTRARVPANRLTANGDRLTTEGGGGAGEPPPFDVWFAELQREYPPAAVSGGLITQQAFTAVFLEREASRPPADVWAEMRRNLENQKAGPQWRAEKIPRMDRWLALDLWKQRPVEEAVKASGAWTCLHLEQCDHQTMCRHKDSMPHKYPVRQAVAG